MQDWNCPHWSHGWNCYLIRTTATCVYSSISTEIITLHIATSMLFPVRVCVCVSAMLNNILWESCFIHTLTTCCETAMSNSQSGLLLSNMCSSRWLLFISREWAWQHRLCSNTRGKNWHKKSQQPAASFLWLGDKNKCCEVDDHTCVNQKPKDTDLLSMLLWCGAPF